MAKVTMPQLGESVAEGTIGKWLKQPGDHVDKYEPLLEVITDKVNAEVPSPFEGVLKEILAQEGDTVPNDAEIAIIDTGDDAAAPRGRRPRSPRARQHRPRGRRAPTSDRSRRHRPPVATPAVAAPASAPAAATLAPAATLAATGDPDARMTPAVRRLLREHGLSPDQIQGTGGGGRITRDDVLAVVEIIRTGGSAPVAVMAAAPGPASAPSAPASVAKGPAGGAIAFPDGVDELLLPMTQMRKGIAAQMTRALAVPHAYVHMEVDASGLVRAREAREARLPGARGHLAQLCAVRHQGGRRGAQAVPDVQRALDRRRHPRQAAHPHGRRGRRGRRAAGPGRPRRRPALDQRAQSRDRRGGRPGASRQAPPRRLRRDARSRSTTPVGSGRT